MKAMILAAGYGTRMRPLTDHTPKPLLPAGGKPLIVWQIEKLRQAGFTELVINHSHLGQQLEDSLGDGRLLDVHIQWSHESTPLETAGGILQALPLLGNSPFLVINGDIWIDYPLQQLHACGKMPYLAHLVLVDNPPHHLHGDFAFVDNSTTPIPLLCSEGDNLHTFSGLSVLHPQLFAGLTPGKHALGPLLRQAMQQQQVSGELFQGRWIDIGTPERLSELDRILRNS